MRPVSIFLKYYSEHPANKNGHFTQKATDTASGRKLKRGKTTLPDLKTNDGWSCSFVIDRANRNHSLKKEQTNPISFQVGKGGSPPLVF
jgi:hypothetical protein